MLIISIISVLLLAPAALTKYHTRKWTVESYINEPKCHYISKFFTHNGKGNIKFNVTHQGFETGGEGKIYLYGYSTERRGDDFDINAGLEDKECGIKSAGIYDLKVNIGVNMQLAKNNYFHSFYDSPYGVVRDRPIEYGFYLCDCDRYFKNVVNSDPLNKDISKSEIKLVFELFDSKNNSHLSYEESTVMEFLILAIVANGILVAYGVLKILYFRKENVDQQLDYPLVILTSIPATMIFALFSKLAHFIFYYFTGKHLFFGLLEIAGRSWIAASEHMLNSLLILLIAGWGVKYIQIHETSKIIMMGFFAFTLVLRYTWNFFAYYYSDDIDIGHMYDGKFGILEILNSFVFLGFFMYQYFGGNIRANNKYKNFRRLMFTLAVIYLLIKPVLILMTNYFSPHNRHMLSMIVSKGAHLFLCMVLQFVLTTKSGVYRTISLSTGSQFTMEFEGTRFD